MQNVKVRSASILKIITVMAFVCAAQGVQAQILVEDAGTASAPAAAGSKSQPTPTGKGAATEYFKKREGAEPTEEKAGPAAGAFGEHYLAIYLGGFVNDTAHRWGTRDKIEDPGEGIFGVTYRVGEWRNSMDMLLRADLISYDVDDDKPLKLSLMPVIAFPDARSSFPLYFGAGVGAGIFFKQAGDESDLSIDYNLLIGARFPQLFDGNGFMFETGLKGHLHALSSGQHRGVYLALGGVFSF